MTTINISWDIISLDILNKDVEKWIVNHSIVRKMQYESSKPNKYYRWYYCRLTALQIV